MIRLQLRLLAAMLSFALTSSLLLAQEKPRVAAGLQVLYTFDEGSGELVVDHSETSPPLNLKIEKLSAIEWGDGFLRVKSLTNIISTIPAQKITNSVSRSGGITIEAWIKPLNNRQKGPARIVSLSGNPSERNFTLGQNEDKYDVRYRTSRTDGNGNPSTSTRAGEVKLSLTHVVYTRTHGGQSIIYLDGKRRGRKQTPGDLNNWSHDFPLVLADEVGGGRSWLGEFHLVAIYNRALSTEEVEQNFHAGEGPAMDPQLIAENERRRFFENEVAPLLARKCLDCHDASTKGGGLDLSAKATALAGGESGPVLSPGKPADSLLFDMVQSDAMPPEGSVLTAPQKETLKRWINDGAIWSLEKIDPAIYTNGSRLESVWLRRLTRQEYIETIRAAVGVDISKEAQEILPADVRADGFSNTAYNLNVDLKHIEAYARLAEIVVSRMDVPKFVRRFTKSRKLSTDDTMRKSVGKIGKWLLRGPLKEREINNYSGIATTVASAGGSYDEAMSLIIQALLQSPRFLYRVENQRGDGSTWPVGEYELASRMSYIIWGAPPDSKLLKATEEGKLFDQQALADHVDRMLEDPRALQRARQFVSEWLNLDRLEHLQPNQQRFPNWDPEIASDMRRETLAFFEEVAWKQKRPLAELFNAQVTFASPRLAKHYGLKPVGEDWTRYDLSSVPARGGILTQGSVLTIGGDDASMVTRGLFVLSDVLRGIVKEPPPDLDTTPVPARPGMSHRGIAEQRIANVACGGCHEKFEPLAFGLEKFNGLGSFGEKDEHGNDLREDGEILFPGAAEPVKYDTTAQLMNLLAASPRVSQTLTWKLTQFALGRPLVAADAPIVEQIHTAAQKEGGSYTAVIKAIILSDLVQKTQTEAAEKELETEK